MIGLDTNVLVRYFVQDDARQSALAARLVERQLDRAAPGHVSLVALAELVWVMRTRYQASRELVVDIVSRLLGDDRFVVQASSQVWAALDAYRNSVIDFGDTLIAALDRAAGCAHTVSFDRRASRLPGIVMLS